MRRSSQSKTDDQDLSGGGPDLKLQVPVDSSARLEGPAHTVTNTHEPGIAGHGVSWHESTVSARWKDETGAVHVLEAHAPDGETLVFTQIPLTGVFRHTTPDGVELTSANVGLTRSAHPTGLYDLNEGRDLHMFGINAPVDVIARWFGNRIPEPLRPFLADKPSQSLHCPTGMPRPLEEALRLALSYDLPLRRLATEAVSLQIMTHMLQRLCDGAAQEHGLAAREAKAARDAYEMILSRLASPPLAGELAAHFGLPVRRMQLAFRTIFGMSLHEATVQARFDAACRALREGVPIKTIAHELGYAHVSNFTYAFRRRFGTPPGAWAAGKRPKT